MPTTCGFPNCRFRSRYRGAEDNRHFYRVPKKPAVLRKRWLDAIGRTEETIVSQLRVCSGHFHGGEKHEGDIPVADPSVDPLVRIELPPKPTRLPNTTPSSRIGFSLRGGRGRGCGPTMKPKANMLRSGLLSFLNRTGSHNVLNATGLKFSPPNPSSYPLVAANTEHHTSSKWLHYPLALPTDDRIFCSDKISSESHGNDNVIDPINYIPNAQDNEMRSFTIKPSLKPEYNAYIGENHIVPGQATYVTRPQFSSTPHTPSFLGRNNASNRLQSPCSASRNSAVPVMAGKEHPTFASPEHSQLTHQHFCDLNHTSLPSNISTLHLSQWIATMQEMVEHKHPDGQLRMQLFTNLFMKMLAKQPHTIGSYAAMLTEGCPIVCQDMHSVYFPSFNTSSQTLTNHTGTNQGSRLGTSTTESEHIGLRRCQNRSNGSSSVEGELQSTQLHPVNLTNPIDRSLSGWDNVGHTAEGYQVPDRKVEPGMFNISNETLSDTIQHSTELPQPEHRVQGAYKEPTVSTDTGRIPVSQYNGNARRPVVVFVGIPDISEERPILDDIAEVMLLTSGVAPIHHGKVYTEATDLVLFTDSEPSEEQLKQFLNLRNVWLVTRRKKTNACANPGQGLKIFIIHCELFNLELLSEFVVSLLLLTTNRIMEFGRLPFSATKRPLSVPPELRETWSCPNDASRSRDIVEPTNIPPIFDLFYGENRDKTRLIIHPSTKGFGQSIQGLKIGIVAQDILAKNLVALLEPFGCSMLVHGSTGTGSMDRLANTNLVSNLELMVAEVDWLIVVEGYNFASNKLNPPMNEINVMGQLTDSLLLKVKPGASLLYLSTNQKLSFSMLNLRNALLTGHLGKVLLGQPIGNMISQDCFRHPNFIHLPDCVVNFLRTPKEQRICVARTIRQVLLTQVNHSTLKNEQPASSLGFESRSSYCSLVPLDEQRPIQKDYDTGNSIQYQTLTDNSFYRAKSREEYISNQQKGEMRSPETKLNFGVTSLVSNTKTADHPKTYPNRCSLQL